MFCLTVDDEIELCLLEERHAEDLFTLIENNRAYLREWLPWLDITTSAADNLNFIKSAREQFARNDGFQTAILYEAQLVGMIGFHRIDWANRSTSLGYWLAAEFQGRGIMTRACRYLIGYAFQEFGLNRVEIRCAPQNRPSCTVAKRLGFSQEGTIRQAEWLYDHFVDHTIYGLLAAEWEGKPGA